MYWDVKTVMPLPDYRIYVEVADGRKGIFDMKPYLVTVFFGSSVMCIILIRWESYLEL